MSIADKLERVLTRTEELKHLLSTAEGGQFGALSKELAELEPLAEKVQVLRAAERARDEAEAMLTDPELAPAFERSYVVVHLDVLERGEKESLENPGGEAVMEKLGGKGAGLPYFAVLAPAARSSVTASASPATPGATRATPPRPRRSPTS